MKTQLHKIQEKSGTYENAALDPAASVFVSAHAGSGKTSLLSRRVLSLLLHGVTPAKILCLTFTKAAAAEMEQRILAELGAWVMADEADLRARLASVLERTPNDAFLARARSLFATVLEAPEGVRIQTIHSFCQSLLARFPVEADISPHFTVMDTRTEQEMLKDARMRLLGNAEGELAQAIGELARVLSADDFQDLLASIVKNKFAFRSLFQRPGAVEKLWQALGVSRDVTPESLAETYFAEDKDIQAMLHRVAEQLLQGEKTNRKNGQKIMQWLTSRDLESYLGFFLTDDYKKRKSLFTGKALTDPVLIERLLSEQERAAQFHEARQSLEIARLSTAVLQIAEELLTVYERIKRSHARMDYDDLILAARDLLLRPGISPWVLFKLDGGIDHVLVDEAQDTSPAQWQIISALTDDFFAGQSKGQGDRSLFIVGDEKQSIFSFQGADVKQLAAMHDYFRARIEASERPLHAMPLIKSFRSVPEILKAVDAVFALPEARAGVITGQEALAHVSHRAGHAGLVELWPLLTPQEGQRFSPQSQLVRTIADTIRGWLDAGKWQAGDIMILVRKRSNLMDMLVRALKRRNIPVAGVDRMVLSENLAVQDLIALGQILLLPEDDLSLASLLKSPIGNLSEEELFALCWERGDKNLWKRLEERAATISSPLMGEENIYDLLAGLRAKADYLPPYELYAHALDTLGLRKRFIGRMGEEYADAIDEFLSQALVYQENNTPSLQGFLHWLSSGESEIKRDMEQSKQMVRIMTVHGAKGLQAPVVILPDTVSYRPPQEKLFWQEELPLWVASKTRDNSISRRLREEEQAADLEEYRRLLYVAMTRAADCLYICGATGEKKANEKSWYSLIQRGLQPLAEKCNTPAGEGWRFGAVKSPLPTPLPRAGEGSRSFAAAGEGAFTFLSKPPPQEATPQKPLAPSQFGAEPAAASPLSAAIYSRGLFIHLLLQHLPEVEKEKRLLVADALAASYRRHMKTDEIRRCIQEALALMENPDFTHVFSSQALAEAPIAGTVSIQGKPFVVSGQIDRLCIGEKEIWVVDYKTNREPPEVIPTAYARQMALYRLLLKEIYPKKTIRCALLWTAVPRMDILDEALLAT